MMIIEQNCPNCGKYWNIDLSVDSISCPGCENIYSISYSIKPECTLQSATEAKNKAVDTIRKKINFHTTEYTVEELMSRNLAISRLSCDNITLNFDTPEIILAKLPQPSLIQIWAKDDTDKRELIETSCLTSLISFYNDRYKIPGDIIPSLKGLTFSNLPSRLRREFLQASIRIIVFESVTDQEILKRYLSFVGGLNHEYIG